MGWGVLEEDSDCEDSVERVDVDEFLACSEVLFGRVGESLCWPLDSRLSMHILQTASLGKGYFASSRET